MSDTRSYITALGSSSVLVGAIALACAALAGVVGYQGMPSDSDTAGSSRVTVEAARPDAAFDRGPNAKAKGGSDERAGGGAASDREAGEDSSGAGRGDSAGGLTGGQGADGGTSGGNGGGDPAQPPAGGQPPSGEDPPTAPPPAPGNPAAPAPGGPLGSAVKGVEDAVGATTGVQIPIGQLTNPVTAPVDGLLGPRAGPQQP